MFVRRDRFGSTSQYIVLQIPKVKPAAPRQTLFCTAEMKREGVGNLLGEYIVPVLLAINQELTPSKASRELGSSAMAFENDRAETTHGLALVTPF